MRRRVPSLSWSLRWLCALTLLAATAPVFGQSATPGFISTPSLAQSAAVPPATFASDAPPAVIGSLLEKGQSLETAGHWAEALTYYEDALREHPADHSLEGRYDVARLHYNFEQRLADRSYLDSVRTMRGPQARDTYVDLLSKIERITTRRPRGKT